MRRFYAAIRGVHTCEDATIRCRSKRLGDAWISTRSFGETCYSERIKEIWTLAIIIRYEDNGLVRYDGKEYVESLSKVRREKNATGALQIGKSITVNTKSHFWKAVVVDLSLPQPPTQLPRAQEKGKQYRLQSLPVND